MSDQPRIKIPPLPLTGGCQCGAVRYEVHAKPLTLYACHCTECQKQSSSAFGMSLRVPKESVVIRGVTGVATRPDPHAPPVEGLFCPSCGSRLIHQRPERDTVNIKAGTLDDTSWLVPVGHLWAASSMPGFRPEPGPLVYDHQPESYDDLIEAWAEATQ
ncbi:MAG: GFA family protein [Pseudomonadota bacterium]